MDQKELEEYYKRKFEIMKRVHHSRQKKVEDAFSYIRKTFFPNWDKKKKWKVFAANPNDPRNIYASCDHVNKVIWFKKIPQRKIQFLVIMLDEISHARVPGLIPKGHDRAWVKNMRQAEKIAKEKKLTELAKEINFHIKINKLFKKHDEDELKRLLEKENNRL